MVEHWFSTDNARVSLIDVGGQRSQRRKWLHCFEHVSAIIFVVACSEYDQVLREDTTVNRMQESLRLFSSICSSKWFVRTAMILFFNKMDVFQEKLKKSSLKVCFPKYCGSQNFDEARGFISTQFALQICNEREIYLHFTCAKDQTNVKTVFNACKDQFSLNTRSSINLF